MKKNLVINQEINLSELIYVYDMCNLDGEHPIFTLSHKLKNMYIQHLLFSHSFPEMVHILFCNAMTRFYGMLS